MTHEKRRGRCQDSINVLPTLACRRGPGVVGLALLWLALCPMLSVSAQSLPPRPNPPRLVNDLAGLMQPGEASQLEQKLVAYNDSTSSQIAVVTVPNLDGNEIADYAQKLYESWGIGRKGKNNGILILVAQQEHTARIQTGYGLEGAVPDAIAKRIISNTLVPAFRQNQYYAGLDRATDQLIALAKGEYQADPADARWRTRPQRLRHSLLAHYWGHGLDFYHAAQPGRWRRRRWPAQPGLWRRLYSAHHFWWGRFWWWRLRWRWRGLWRRGRRRLRRFWGRQQWRRRRQRQLVNRNSQTARHAERS